MGVASTSKELRVLIRQAEKQGWVIERRKSGHLCWTAPSGGHIFTGFSPSDYRVVQNTVRELRKLGFETKEKH